MALQNLVVRDESGKHPLTICLKDTPAERGGGNPGNSYCGARVSRGFQLISMPNLFLEIDFDTIERNEKGAADTFDIIIQDAGFYVFGFDIDIQQNILHDVEIFAEIHRDNDVIASKQILIEEVNTSQNEFYADYKYLKPGELITLEIKHSLTNIHINYAALFVFKVEKPDILPKGPCIKSYLKFEGNVVDEKNFATFIAKNGPLFVSGANGQAINFQSQFLQGISSAQIDLFGDTVTFADGFTVSLVFKADGPAGSKYLTLAGKWFGATDQTQDQYHLFYDYTTDKVYFVFRKTDGTYKFICTPAGKFDFNDWQRVTLTYNTQTRYFRLYINNKVEASYALNPLEEISLTSTQFFTVGAYNIGGSTQLEHSDGTVDELLVCCREYTSDDINVIYNGGDVLTLEDIQDIDAETGGGGAVNLPIALSDTSYDNSGTGLTSTNGQDVITELKLLIDAIGAITTLTYTQGFSVPSWTLNVPNGRYEFTIPQTTHGLNDPGIVQMYRDVAGTLIECGAMNVEIDDITKDITIGVNDVPDGRFAGRINILSMS